MDERQWVGSGPRHDIAVSILRWRVAAPGGRWREEITTHNRRPDDWLGAKKTARCAVLSNIT